MKRFVIDTNVTLRFLLADDPTQSPKARALFELAESGKVRLWLTHLAVAELAWVLKSFFEFERVKVGATLRGLLLHQGIEVDDLDLLLAALDRFSRINADFTDCYAAAVAAKITVAVTSYDRDFRKFADVACLTPEEILKAT